MNDARARRPLTAVRAARTVEESTQRLGHTIAAAYPAGIGPGDIWTILGELRAATTEIARITAALAGTLETDLLDGRLSVDTGQHAGDPVGAVSATTAALDSAQKDCRRAGEAIRIGQTHCSELTPTDPTTAGRHR
ncbi:hypothetical protein [Actinocatenispora rupis]|uniref:Uncharacterized protein n=1 Tax=Actinocatenispora rupis TaxID=519421 RepID=A0A8J3J8X8_9ACTN|nr:hypothetical protein [Actinocatenispora rupis]GID12312.1 hypothetical protein Aru02nite_32010 [Actinocatenispora rupis]